MAKVIGNPYGEFSGKLGGSVFARNKAGAYVRQYVKGTQPNTQAQLAAKAAFGAIGGYYKTLTSSERAYWGEYALNHFVPKHGTNVGQYTAQQAFVSLNSVFSNAVRNNRNWELSVNNFPIGGLPEFVSFIQPTGQPPSNSSAALWDTIAGDGVTFNIQASTFSDQGSANITLQVGDSFPKAMTNFQNPYGPSFGWAIFASNGNPSENMHYQNPEKYLIGYLEGANVSDPTELEAVTSIRINTIDTLNVGDYKQFPFAGEFVNLSLYMVTAFCQINKVGTRETIVSVHT